MERFFVTYPALTYLSSKPQPHEGALPILIAFCYIEVPFGFIGDLLGSYNIDRRELLWVRNKAAVVYIKNNRQWSTTLDEEGVRIFKAGYTAGILGLFLWGLLNEYDEDVHPGANRNEALMEAAENGDVEIVRALLEDKRVNPTINFEYALSTAAGRGNYHVVDLLLNNKRIKDDSGIPRGVDPTPYLKLAIQEASSYGKGEIVNLILDSVNHLMRENALTETLSPTRLKSLVKSALTSAAAGGHADIVEYLLTERGAIPTTAVLRLAVTSKNPDVVYVILEDERTTDEMIRESLTIAKTDGIREMLEARLR